jgi:hypothetical protein
LTPLVFRGNKVYCNYQYNAEALPPYAQNPNGSKLISIVYGVPADWTVSSWLVEILTFQTDDIQFTTQIFNILVQNFKKLDPALFFFKEIFVKLMNRTLKKLRHAFLKNQSYYDQQKITHKTDF